MVTPNAPQNQEFEREEVLRFIVEKERLTKTLRHFDITKRDLLGLLLNQTSQDNQDHQDNHSPTQAISPPPDLQKEESEDSKNHKKKSTSKKTSKKAKLENLPPPPAVENPEPVLLPEEEGTEKQEEKATKPTKKEKAPTKLPSSAEEEEQDPGESEPKSTSKKSNRRQSSPRGRRAASFEPEHYTYQRLLIYTDGAARGNPGESGAGVVLKTPEGEEVGRFGKYLGKNTNNFAEYQALLLGLYHAREFGASDITILSDSELLVRQLLGEYRVRASHLRDLFEQAKDLLTMFEKYQIKRIGREKNMEADSMANRAIDEKL